MNESLNILVACEESQRVTTEMLKKGHNAFSCDILPCSGGIPGRHINSDVSSLLGKNVYFRTEDGEFHYIDKWDMIIAHPPCTYLTVSGNRWFDVDTYGDMAIQRMKNREEAIKFFMMFINADCDYIAVENPVGIMSTVYRKPDQYIQPYWFGDKARKKTGLWLKNLPKLHPTDMVDPGDIMDGGYSTGASAHYAVDENGKILKWADPRTAIIRSKTFPGIAKAFTQWADYILAVRQHNK